MLAHDFLVARNPRDEENQRHGDRAVDNGGNHQRLDRIDADEVDHQADEGCNGDDSVEQTPRTINVPESTPKVRL